MLHLINGDFYNQNLKLWQWCNMKLEEILKDKRLPDLIKNFWHIEFSFNDKSFEETHYYEKVVLGHNFNEFYIEGHPFSHYYKKFGNLIKAVPKKEKEVTKILIGCPGRKFKKVIDLEDKTLDEFFKMINS